MPRRRRTSKRRPLDPANPADDLTYVEALRYERTRWPSLEERRAFWRRPEVPAEIRDGSRPDPRVVLEMEGASDLKAFRRRDEEWQAARLGWLSERAGAA